MAELNFRTIVVPEKKITSFQRERLLSRIKFELEACGLTNVSLGFSHVKKTDNEDYPEIEELVLEVHAQSRTSHQAYEEFLFIWDTLFGSKIPTYIELNGNDYFVNTECYDHNLSYDSIGFGVLPHDGQFYEFAKLKKSQNGNITHFFHDNRTVVIEYGTFQMTFSYDNIRNIFADIRSWPSKVYLDLFNPPIITRVERGYGLSPKRTYPLKYRNLNLVSPEDADDLSQPLIDSDVLGRSSVLCLTSEDSEKLRSAIFNIHYKCSEKSVYFSNITTVERAKPSDPIIQNMDFGCAYLLSAIFKRNFVVVLQAADVEHNLRKLSLRNEQNPESLERALSAVLLALDSGKILNYWHVIDDQYSHYIASKDEINFCHYIVPPNCCTIRKITITPTRQLLWPAEVMYGNRILRKFDSEYALRATFRDDNMSRLSFTASRSDSGVFESCIERPMTSGVRIGSRKYEFLAWSNSQIRDHGVWMYARDQRGNTSALIRQWMGDFSHIRNVPKYMARMGQCFSQTEDALSVPLHPQHVRTEPDVEGGWDPVNSKPYCFSDGVGRISMELAAQVHEALGHDRLCSAFQIRYGGYKGMLVVDPTLTDAQIVFRNSMKKFDCPNSTRLEIARTSGPVPLQLNRPFITLLNGLGVRHRMFSRLQEDVLQTLTDILYDEREAAKFLQAKTPLDSCNYMDLSKSGIHLTTDPFFKSILLALHRHHIEKIKLRANITIDPSKGRNMLGVMDEYGKLSYGQVFVQYTKDISYGETTKDTVILTGEVLVTKNPCMHPGDVRKFQAVDVPDLRHIVDCIVFPRNGFRPHPSEMAGSDLDGDEYAVLWCSELIFERRNENPAHFPAARSSEIPRITVGHAIQFCQEYVKNDQVGSIANAHLAHADFSGVSSPICLKIAEKFSVAIDFAKNGQSQQLSREERPTHYPDFMEKSTGENYKSKKALGKMYRVCKDFESENQATSIVYVDVKVDPDLDYTGWEMYKDSAVRSKNKYYALLRSVLRNYGVLHEAEALSGAFTNLHCRFQERRDRNEIEKVIIGCIKTLNKSMMDEFMEEFQGSGDVHSVQRRMLQKASAWYMVTYSDPNAKVLSFPWTVSKYLANIKALRTLAKDHPFPPAIVNLNERIIECESKNLLPQYVETGIWNDYEFSCSPRIVKRALRTLILWAEDVEIIERPGKDTRGLMFVNVFIKLFLHVAERSGYVFKRNARVKDRQRHYSTGQLCIEFLKFCSTFRFYNPEEITSLLTFPLYKYSALAKRAIVSYHKFALSGKLQSLNFDKKVDDELIDMKPLMIENKIFVASPIDPESLQKAEAALIKYSKVNELKLREILQMKKVCVSAVGTELALKELKSILRRKHEFLRTLFRSGIMPETSR